MKLTIETAHNGFKLHNLDAGLDDQVDEVYEFSEFGPNDELGAVARLLWAIQDHLGYFGSKHDAQRIRISIEDQNIDPDAPPEVTGG